MLERDYLLEEIEWFSKIELQNILKKLSISLDSAQEDKTLRLLNKISHQFFDIAWRTQHNLANFKIEKKLSQIKNTSEKLLKSLEELKKIDLEIFGYLAIGAAEKVEIFTSEAEQELPATELYTQKNKEADRILETLPRSIKTLLDGIIWTETIYKRRKERTKSENEQHKGNPALDELLHNLLKYIWQGILGKKITHTKDAANDKPSETVIFCSECLFVLFEKIPEYERYKELKYCLLVDYPALRERLRRLPTRMDERERKAAEIRESGE